MGEVISRDEGGKVTRFAYNYALGLAPIVAEYTNPKGLADPSGLAPTRYYVWTPQSGALLYMIDAADANKVYHYHFDRTGSTLALTDAEGKMTDAYAYDPYGKVLKHDGKNTQPFTFVGRWGVQQEGNHYHMRERYYDPAAARFLSRDSAWPKIVEPRELNPYVYARSNPIGRGSPTGIDPEFNDIWRFNEDNSEFEEPNDLQRGGGGGGQPGDAEQGNAVLPNSRASRVPRAATQLAVVIFGGE